MSKKARNVKDMSMARNPTQEEKVCVRRSGPSRRSCRCGRKNSVPLLPAKAKCLLVREVKYVPGKQKKETYGEGDDCIAREDAV